MYKYGLRDGKNKIAFFYTESPKQPKEIYYRLNTEKEKTKLELLGEYAFQGDYDTYGQIKVRNPKTKKEFFLMIDEFLVRVTNESFTQKEPEKVATDEILYFPEITFELGKERLYAIVNPVGFSRFFYRSNPQTSPQNMEILNTEEAYGEGKPYIVNFPKQGKATIEHDYGGKKMTVTFKNKTKKVFIETTPE